MLTALTFAFGVAFGGACSGEEGDCNKAAGLYAGSGIVAAVAIADGANSYRKFHKCEDARDAYQIYSAPLRAEVGGAPGQVPRELGGAPGQVRVGVGVPRQQIPTVPVEASPRDHPRCIELRERMLVVYLLLSQLPAVGSLLAVRPSGRWLVREHRRQPDPDLRQDNEDGRSDKRCARGVGRLFGVSRPRELAGMQTGVD